MEFLNPVLVSVILMSVLCLLKVNVLVSILIAAICAGLLTKDMSIGTTMNTLIEGMGGNSETALSYILLGALANAIHESGLAGLLGKSIEKIFGKKGIVLIFAIAIITCFSQNLIPIHIAFIPILIPPLLGLMNKLKIDRRAVACALTFGLKTPYILIPAGFGMIFHTVISSSMADNNVAMATGEVWKSMILPAIGMVIGLVIAVTISYRKEREYKTVEVDEVETGTELNKKQLIGAGLGAVSAFVIQIFYSKAFPDTAGALPLGALTGLIIMIAFGTIKISNFDKTINGGIHMMGFIAFVMLVASGYGAVLRETGGVESLVAGSAAILGDSKMLAAVVMLALGLVITMGIGTSFGTIPIIATIFVPLCVTMGFSPAATACLIGVAGALGDAGSPASDSTLGPTAGLNADGQHDHIRDTCIPTFLHYNIPLFIMGIIASMIL